MILYLAADLVWASRIKATADGLGLACRPARSVEMLEARLADSEVRGVLLDLEKPDEAMAMLACLRGEGAPEARRGIRVLAWAPHVEKSLMQRARDAGADEVLTRGAFDHNLEDVLLRMAEARGEA